MKTFNKGQVSCDNCWLAIHAPNGGYICMEQIGKSLSEMPGCPGAITDGIVQKAHAAVHLLKTKAEVEALHEMEKTYFAGFESGVRCAREKADFKQEQLAKTKAELDQLLSEAKLLVLQLKSAKLRLEDDPPLAKDIGDIGDKLAENRKKLIDRQSAPIAAAGEREQSLGTIAEPAEPPPASELPPDKAKNKIRVKMVMNFDLIAEYFCWAARLREEERKVNELREKKSALEAEIMEKLLEK